MTASTKQKSSSECELQVGDLVSYDYSTAWFGGLGEVVAVLGHNRVMVKAIEVPEGVKQYYPNGDESSWKTSHLRHRVDLGETEKEAPVEEQPKDEAVDHPAHYGGKDDPYEVIKVAEAWGLHKDAYLFNVLKYIARAAKKGALLQDHKKAYFYLGRKIKNLEEE